MKRDLCRHCGHTLVYTLAGTSKHCIRCAKATAAQILTVSVGQFKAIREQTETRDKVTAE